MTANFSAESLTLRYLTSCLSNSKDSRHGALATPVISRSTATKSAARTESLSVSSAGSKLDLVTVFRGKVDGIGAAVVKARAAARESAPTVLRRFMARAGLRGLARAWALLGRVLPLSKEEGGLHRLGPIRKRPRRRRPNPLLLIKPLKFFFDV